MLEWLCTTAQEKVAMLRCRVAERARAFWPASILEPIEPPAAPLPLSIEDRWTRATGAVTAAISGFGRVQSLQAAAACQIDAADYTFQRLLEELSFAMPIQTADGSALRALLATVGERESLAEATLAA